MRRQAGPTFGGRLLKPNVGRVSVVCITRQALRGNTKHSLSGCLTAQVAGYNPPYILLLLQSRRHGVA